MAKSRIWITVTLCLLASLIWISFVRNYSRADGPSEALRLPHDVDRLPDGHTLITAGGRGPSPSSKVQRMQSTDSSQVIEVDEAGNVVWSFSQGLDFAHNADRLPNGHMLISDTGHDRVIEIDATGTVVWTTEAITLSDGSTLSYPNDANWLPNDHLLITDRDNHRVIEVGRDGTIVWQFGETGVPGNDASHLNGPHNADRLSNGNTIIADSNNKRIIEVAPNGTIVWEYNPIGSNALNWPRDADRLANGNTLITDSRNDRIIEVTPDGQVIWQYDGVGMPYDADRLANGNTLISDSRNNRVIEVSPDGAIVWQYPAIAMGTIAGTVRDASGQPLSGVNVTVLGTAFSDITDASGRYTIIDVPVASPRYIITASKSGYLEAQAGNIDVSAGMTTTLDLTLQPGTATTETLHVMVGHLLYRDPSSEKLIPPPTAVLSPTLYPAQVLPYLQAGEYIESDDPSIVAVAQTILAGLTPEQRLEQTTVAHAVYVWMVQNIAYDLTQNYPNDVTCGNWQTTFGAWGHSFAEWLYTAKEVLEEGRGICIEHARLATALLRAVGIPARPAPLMAHPVTQWWVQLPDGSGFWANMDTSVGRSAYMRDGNLWANFPSTEEHNLGFWAVDADAPIHMDWWTDNPCIWHEDYGQRTYYPATAAGLAQAQAALAHFAATGELPTPTSPPPSTLPYYEVNIRGFEVDLTNAQAQSRFEARFALAMESDYVRQVDQVYWTNHPGWVTRSWLETESNSTTGESQSWYCVELNRSDTPTPTATPSQTSQLRVYLPLILKGCSPETDGYNVITPVDNSLYYAGTEDECWDREDLPSSQAWFEELIPLNVGSANTPIYFGIGVHIEPQAEYMDNAVYQRDRERLRRLAEIVAAHGGVLTVQTQTPFNNKAQQLGDTIFADLAAQGHEIALHFHEDAHIPNADSQSVLAWVEAFQEEIDLIEALSGTEVRTWSGGNTYAHVFEAAEAVGLEININYKNRYSQQSDERFTILTPWRPSGAASIEERTTHDPAGAIIYIPSGVYPVHCEKLEAFPRPYCYEAFDYVTVALRNSLQAVTEGKVNAFYATLHPGDFFGPGSDEDKLQIWDQWLTAVLDPLVADGRLQWATMSDIADAFVAWEEAYGESVP